MQDYWDGRFKKEGRIWGDIPSSTVERAVDLFTEYKVKKVLVPGAGYGRNAKVFSSAGFQVTGIEISGEAVRLAKEYTPEIRLCQGSVLDMPVNSLFDAIYCFNVLHLFRAADRKVFLDQCMARLKDGGLLFFTVFSDKESSYGRGAEVERGTFESKPGRPVHYFTEKELQEQFSDCAVLSHGTIEEHEDHGEEGPHTHILRYIAAQKRSEGFDGERYKKASRHQKEWGQRMISSLRLEGHEHILDLGCGDGVLTEKLAALVPNGMVLGIDSSSSMIHTAKQLEKNNLRFLLMKIEDMDFDDEFDLIFSNATLHWIKGHKELLGRAFKSLKRGGHIRFNFAGKGNCDHFTAVAQQTIADPQFARYFQGFEWPWYTPDVSGYEILDCDAGFADVIVWEENADRMFTKEELIGWLDQPTLIPFMKRMDELDKAKFRKTIIERMLERTKQSNGRYFETFRRINVFARKPAKR